MIILCVFNEKETSKVKSGSTCQNGYYCIDAGGKQENGWSKDLGFCTPAGKAVAERKVSDITGVAYGCGYLYESLKECQEQCGVNKCKLIKNSDTTFYAPDLTFIPGGQSAISNLSSVRTPVI